MSYSFNPMSDEELEKANLLTQGIYNFQVVKSTRKISHSGNSMAELQLKVWDNEGKVHTVFDYLVFSQVNLNIKKISHFCKAVGLYEEYKKGVIPEELEGLAGKAEIDIQEERQKPTGGVYPAKNIIIDYIKNDAIQRVDNILDTDDFSDTIPF